MGTGLIYAAIVAAWAVYLVPLWLRRHDEATAARPVDDVPSEDVPSTSRVLARRQSARPAESGGQVAVPPQRTSSTSPEFSSAYAHVRRPGSASGVSAAARRRRTLFLLTVLTTLAAVLSMAGVVGWGSVLVPVGLTAGFLVVSAAAARQERSRRWAEEPVARRVADDRRRVDDRREVPSPRTVSRHAMPARAARPSAGGGAYDTGRGSAPGTAWSTPAAGVARETARPAEPESDRDREITVEAHRATAAYEPSAPPVPAAETPVPAASSRVSLGPSVPSGELWDPVRVPLPTYVTKAKAPRTVRTVDLAQSGIWTAAGTTADGLLSRPEDAPKMLLDESGPGDRSDADRRAGNGERDSGDGNRRAVGD